MDAKFGISEWQMYGFSERTIWDASKMKQCCATMQLVPKVCVKPYSGTRKRSGWTLMGEGTPWLVVTFCMLQCSCTLDSVLGLRKAIGMQGVEERRGGGLIPKIKQKAKPNYSIPGPKRALMAQTVCPGNCFSFLATSPLPHRGSLAA